MRSTAKGKRDTGETKRRATSDECRHCIACGVIPPHGPLMYEWDGHGAMKADSIGRERWSVVLTCSDDCRKKMGFKRRKPAAVAQTFFDFSGLE